MVGQVASARWGRVVRGLSFLLSAHLVAGCVASQNIVVDRNVVAGHSCEQLEQELIRLGAIRAEAVDDQNMTTSKNVTASVLPVRGFLPYSNAKTAERNEKKAAAQIANIYSVWDEKRCSEWLYKRNSKDK